MGSIIALTAKTPVQQPGVEYCIIFFPIFQNALQIIEKKKATFLSVCRCEVWLAELFLIFICGIFLAKKMDICSHCVNLADQSTLRRQPWVMENIS